MDVPKTVALRSGERVLWEGKTEPFGVLSGPAGRAILRQWLIGAGMIAAILALYVTGTRYLSAVPIVTLCLTMAAMLVIPFLERARLLRRRYYITNERAIVASGSRAASMERAAIDEYRLCEGRDGAKSVVLGSALRHEPDKELRYLGLYPEVNREPGQAPFIDGMVFYGVEDAEAVKRALAR